LKLILFWLFKRILTRAKNLFRLKAVNIRVHACAGVIIDPDGHPRAGQSDAMVAAAFGALNIPWLSIL
jgi:hypothetical protein